MFDFNEDKLTDEQVMEVATANNVPPLRVAINANGYKGSAHLWCDAEELFSIKLSRKYSVVVQRFWKQAINGKGVVGIRSLFEVIRKIQPFVGRDGVMHDLKENILPALQDAGIVCVIGDKVYAHPVLVGMDNLEVRRWCNVWRSDNSKDLIHGYDADEVRKAIEFYRKAKSLLNGE